MFADLAFAADVRFAAWGIGDDLVSGAQLHGLLAGIDDHDGVGPEILIFLRRRPSRHEVGLDGHFDLAGDGAVHADGPSSKLATQIAKEGCHHIEKLAVAKPRVSRSRAW